MLKTPFPTSDIDGPDRPRINAEMAMVVGVDASRFLVQIVTTSGRTYDEVEFITPWANNDGNGSYSMPQPNSRVLVVWPNGSAKPVVVGFAPSPSIVSDNREDLHEGDMVLAKTEDGAHIILFNGGLLELKSTSLNQWMFIPIDNITRGITENYELITLGGKLRWGHDRETDGVAGAGNTPLLWQFKDRASRRNHQLAIQAGYIEDGSLFRMLYVEDPTDDDSGNQIGQMRMGKLGKGHVIDLSVDNETTISVGRDVDDDTLVRVNINDTTQSITLGLGTNKNTGATVSLVATDGEGSMALEFGQVAGAEDFEGNEDRTDTLNLKVNGITEIGVEADGRIKVNVDSAAPYGKVRLQIEPDGNISLDTNGFMNIHCDDIKLGSDTSDERLALGDSLHSALNAILKLLQEHRHYTAFGTLTDKMVGEAPSMTDGVLSNKARTER